MTKKNPKGLAELARERLKRESTLEDESEDMKKRRAEGWLFLVAPGKGIVIKPPETNE